MSWPMLFLIPYHAVLNKNLVKAYMHPLPITYLDLTTIKCLSGYNSVIYPNKTLYNDFKYSRHFWMKLTCTSLRLNLSVGADITWFSALSPQSLIKLP